MPPATPATPVAPTPAPRPTPPRPGEMRFELRRLSQPLELRQVTLDPTWNSFKTVMVFVGGILFLLFVWLSAFAIGFNRASQEATTKPTTVVVTPQPAPPPVQQVPTAPEPEVAKVPQMSSFAKCQRHYVLVLHRDPEGACDHLK